MSHLRWSCLLCLSTVLPMIVAADQAPPFTSEFLYEIGRHVYRWEMDETSVLRAGLDADFVIWSRDLNVNLDDHDASRYRELYLPQLQMLATLKKADYTIPEMGRHVLNRNYMLQKVERTETAPADTNAYQKITLNRKALVEYLFRTRAQRNYPDKTLLERLRLALRSAKSHTDTAPLAGPQTVYVAPISPVSNDLWVFHETRGWLIKFSSDFDIDNQACWDLAGVGVQVYDLDTDVVVSLDEVQGSHAFITRDWAARAVFNCIVLGCRIEVTPTPAANAPPLKN